MLRPLQSEPQSTSKDNNSTKFKVPMIAVTNLFEHKAPTIKLPDGSEAKASDLAFTILDENHVYRDTLHLAELHRAFGNAPRDLVAYRPKRLALHETIVAVETRLQVTASADPDKPLHELVTKITRDLEGEVKKEQAKLRSERVQLQARIAHFVHENPLQEDKLPSDGLLASAHFSPVEIAIIKEVYTAAQKRRYQSDSPKLGEFLKHYSWEHAITDRVTDRLYTQLASERISKMVHTHVDKLLEAKTAARLDIPTASERRTFMIAGGQASGKGTSVAQLMCIAKKNHIYWGNVVKINTDSLKPLVCAPDKVKPVLFSQLAQDEAGFINTKIQAQLKQLAMQNKAPHVFIDQVYVGFDQLNLATTGEYKSVDVIVVSIEVSEALKRSLDRGLKSGRFESAANILNCHKNMTAQIPDRLKDMGGKGVFVRIVDNNVQLNEEPILVAEIDCSQKKIHVHREEEMRRLIHKTAINPSAQSDRDIYQKDLSDMDIQTYFKSLRSEYDLHLPIKRTPTLSLSGRQS